MLKEDAKQLKMAELLAASCFPVYDHRYRADPESPFRLYDCLTPAIKAHVRVPEAILPQNYVIDMT